MPRTKSPIIPKTPTSPTLSVASTSIPTNLSINIPISTPITPSGISQSDSVTPTNSPILSSHSIDWPDSESIKSGNSETSDEIRGHFSRVDSILLSPDFDPCPLLVQTLKRKRERTATVDIVTMAVEEMEERIIKRQRHRAGFVSGLIFSASVYAAAITL
jgi:hypothetical protein